MHRLIFCITFIVITISSSGTKIELLKPLEGLRFQEIGELRIITKYKALELFINIATVDEFIKNATENLELIEKLFQNDPQRLKDIEKLKTDMELRKLELHDILYGLLRSSTQLSRQRRFLEIFSSKDERIELDLKQIQETINSLIDAHDGLKVFTDNATQVLNNTVQELGKRATISRAIYASEEAEKRCKALIKLLTQERLNGDIVTISEFEDSIKKISSQLTSREELPYHKIIEYYQNIRVSHTIKNYVIKLKMDIPIIEQSSRTLYRIFEIPVINNGNLMLTDAQWKYIAVTPDESTLMMSLDSCYQQNKTMFYCEAESPLQNINESQDCVTNAFVKRKIDMKLCETTVVKSSNLTFIRLNDGQYFYFTPTNKTLNVTCMGDTQSEYLLENSVGIIELEAGCKAKSDEYTLMKTVKDISSSYLKLNILNVAFDIKEVRENTGKNNSPIIDSFYIDSQEAFRKMAIPIGDVPKINRLHYTAGSNSISDILSYLLVALLLIFIIHVLYRTYMWFLNRCKCLKVKKTADCKHHQAITCVA